jgi:hypothetical protein
MSALPPSRINAEDALLGFDLLLEARDFGFKLRAIVPTFALKQTALPFAAVARPPTPPPE